MCYDEWCDLRLKNIPASSKWCFKTAAVFTRTGCLTETAIIIGIYIFCFDKSLNSQTVLAHAAFVASMISLWSSSAPAESCFTSAFFFSKLGSWVSTSVTGCLTETAIIIGIYIFFDKSLNSQTVLAHAAFVASMISLWSSSAPAESCFTSAFFFPSWVPGFPPQSPEVQAWQANSLENHLEVRPSNKFSSVDHLAPNPTHQQWW